MKKRFAILVAALLGAFLIGTAQAAAATLIVDDDGRASPPANCGGSTPTFNSIETAVEAANAGDTVNVCPGTYTEQVSFEPDDSNITIRSIVSLAAVIKAPASIATDFVNNKAIVRVGGATAVRILRFTITGPGPLNCDSLRYGVRVDSGGSATIQSNHITLIRDTDPASLDPPVSGCQNGVGIQVGRVFVDGPTTGSAVILNNRIDNYQKNGMTIDNAGSNAFVAGNRVDGIGPTDVIAQNGIQVSRGATAELRSNVISDNTYTGPAQDVASSTGVLLFEPGAGVRVVRNVSVRNDDNFAAFTTTSALLRGNRGLNSTRFDGIYMGVDTSDNRIENNFLRGNAEHDCHDDSVGPNNPPALVANFWSNNNGRTENRPGLCRGAHGDDDGDGENDEDDDDDDDDEHHGDDD